VDEQHNGIGQVNSAVVQMNQVTQQNAALVEHASTAARSMSGHAASSRDAASVFKVASAAQGASGRSAMPSQKTPARDTPRTALKICIAYQSTVQNALVADSRKTF
jgi:methyl-accepting chemotaxis protein